MTWLIIIVSALAAGVLQITVGFGAAVLLMSGLPYCVDMITAAAISGTICLYVSEKLAWQYRGSISWNIILLPAICYTVMNIIMIQLLDLFNMRLLIIAFGAFLVILSAYYLIADKRVVLKKTLGTTVACSLASGICAGLFGVGGPLIALYFLATLNTWENYIGCLQIFFL